MTSFAELRAHRSQFHFSLSELLKHDPDRAAFKLKNVIHSHTLNYDFSKTHLNAESLELFESFVEASGLNLERSRLFSGEHVNCTEDRAALHTATRTPEALNNQLKKMDDFVTQLHHHVWKGSTDQPIVDVVNLGIGGSDLGPRFVADALYHFHQKTIRCHFVANVDPEELSEILSTLNPETTLFILASKSFSTQETLFNAELAKLWLREHLKTSFKAERHFVAITSNLQKAQDFGIDPEHCFEISEAIGGRYSLWSNMGLSIAIQIGMDHFKALLLGAHAMDEHFKTQPTLKNIPVMMALVSLWYRNFWAAQSYAILPYSRRLQHFPAYLQQLEMESLGKSVLKTGQPSPHQTGGVIWGGVGTNGQHAFHQLLHQGTLLIPADFITIQQPSYSEDLSSAMKQQWITQHQVLVKHAHAQRQALLQGKTREEAEIELKKAGKTASEISFLAPHKMIPGNRPSIEISLNTLDPFNLGQLIAAYEHKIFALSVFLNINPFDQFGVELGKALASD